MILGSVRNYSPRIRQALRGQRGSLTVEFFLDTGFEGELALPPAMIRQLEADFLEVRFVLMANGQEEQHSIYTTTIDWNEEPRPTEVLALDGNPLLGMLLLEGNHIHIEATEGGEIVIEQI